MLKNIVEWGRPQMTWCMHIASWIPEATNTHTNTHTHRLCNNYCFSAATMAARTRYIIYTVPVLLCFLYVRIL